MIHMLKHNNHLKPKRSIKINLHYIENEVNFVLNVYI